MLFKQDCSCGVYQMQIQIKKSSVQYSKLSQATYIRIVIRISSKCSFHESLNYYMAISQVRVKVVRFVNTSTRGVQQLAP
jgi:hypothetical protein